MSGIEPNTPLICTTMRQYRRVYYTTVCLKNMHEHLDYLTIYHIMPEKEGDRAFPFTKADIIKIQTHLRKYIYHKRRYLAKVGR
jgi:hypothetical protein